MKPGNGVLSEYGTTIFSIMSRLAVEHGAINLGQGFPEGLEPPDVIAAAARAVEAGPHQYPPSLGIPALRQAVAAHEKRFYGLEVDPEGEVMVTSGATEALAACLLGLIEPGDEVVLIEPLYDSYLPMVRRAGGIPRLVRLEAPDWALPRQALAEAFSDKTKLLLLNNPTNPCAKVYSAEELDFIAALLEAHDAYAVCDEVYEHLVFDGLPHIPLITRPGMRRRCLKIGSAGKIFSITNWKVGFITAAPLLLGAVARAHQFLTFTTPIGLQAGVAYGLGKEDGYYQGLVADMQARRDRLAGGLDQLGLTPLVCPGTYFLTADISARANGMEDDDFCRHLTTQAGVAAVPVSPFYAARPPRHLARFCFAKTDAALDGALNRLADHFGG
ncbi:aminotransferase [Roseospirillum parvum]|uniref:Aspartate/methionine/tyrosine aminotransferase n=1 Tax=Roseospirillum parvum TaxID=83401 RepID=A0A1G8EHM0_9PROT|nr:aminotransferase [Roseospirillum parvum]SDH69290.1 Aspartate/methionine/tyrosine aminotransferase [Roseospirillum parvum]